MNELEWKALPSAQRNEQIAVIRQNLVLPQREEAQRVRREEFNQQLDGIGDLFAEVENQAQVEEERKLTAATKIQVLFRGKKARGEVAQQRLDQQQLLVEGEWDTLEQAVKDGLNELVWKGLSADQIGRAHV